MKKITILGSGSWGTALAVMLNKTGHQVCLWSRTQQEAETIEADRENKEYLPGIPLTDGIRITHSREEAVKEAEILILAFPSRYMRQSIQPFCPLITPEQAIVNVSKGLEEETLLPLTKVLEECLPNNDICVLSGPSHAEEVGRDIPTVCVAASQKEGLAQLIQQEFQGPNFRVYTTTDVTGVELGGALKNVIALAAGMSDGLGYGDNSKAALMTRGMAEMSRLGMVLGGKEETFYGLSGMGDLIVTCTSMHSRNRRAGILLGQGKTLEETLQTVHMVVEGVNTAKAAYDLARRHKVRMPIVTEIYQVLFEQKDPRKAVLDLMLRDAAPERTEKDKSVL